MIPSTSLSFDCWIARNAPSLGGAAKSFVASRSATGLYASISAVHAAAQPMVANQELGRTKLIALGVR
jgi:hypothetical protein